MEDRGKTLLTVPEAADFLRCHVSTIYRLLRQNALPGVKVGGQWRISKDNLMKVFSATDTITQPPTPEALAERR